MSAAIVRSPREAWLARRREFLTASDCAAVLEVDPRRGPLAVYLSKISDQADQEESRWMKWGRRVEGAIADGYSDETQRPAVDLGAHELQVHPDLGWLACTLDRQTEGSESSPAPAAGVAPLECKAVAGMKAREWQDEAPLGFQIQLMVQMACTGAAWGSLCALLGGVALRWMDLQRDDAFLAAALPRLEEFWLRVQRRDPPEADALPGTTDAIRALWASEDGETVTLDAEALDLVEQWEAAKVLESAEAERVQEAANRIRAQLGSASFGTLPDGSLVSLRVVKREAYAVKASSYRVLRRFRPKIRRR